jgi:hypothetical protein
MTHVSGEPGTDVYPGLMYTHMTRFDAKPKNDELYAALKFEEVNWQFEPEEGFRTLGSGVCEAGGRRSRANAPPVSSPTRRRRSSRGGGGRPPPVSLSLQIFGGFALLPGHFALRRV